MAEKAKKAEAHLFQFLIHAQPQAAPIWGCIQSRLKLLKLKASFYIGIQNIYHGQWQVMTHDRRGGKRIENV